jgi:hypothetical protein
MKMRATGGGLSPLTLSSTEPVLLQELRRKQRRQNEMLREGFDEDAYRVRYLAANSGAERALRKLLSGNPPPAKDFGGGLK